MRFIYDTDSGALRYDADGSLNGADAILIARLSNLPALSASDIVIF